MTAREYARRAVQTIKAPLPKGSGGTLYVEGVPVDRMDDREYIRRLVASYCIRTALEKGCVKIVIRHPHRNPIEFDVVDLITRTARIAGWPRLPGRIPVNVATMGMLAHGAEIARVRPMVTVSGFESGGSATKADKGE